MESKCGLFVLAVLVCFVQVQSDNLVNRKCVDRPVLQNFDALKYSGIWFEIYRYEQNPTIGCECVHVTYTPNGDKVGVKNCCHRGAGQNCIDGNAVVSFPNHEPIEGRLNVTFFGPPQPSNYVILDTDYTNFAVVYLCSNIENDQSKESFWLLSRSKILSADVKDKAEGLVDKYFDRKSSAFITTKQGDGCAYA